MLVFSPADYQNLLECDFASCVIQDHMGGFDHNMTCFLLDRLNSKSTLIDVRTEYVFNDDIKNAYPNLNLTYDPYQWYINNLGQGFDEYRVHPCLTFERFLCSFNGTPHVSRKLLVSVLKKFGWFDEHTVSKNFAFEQGVIKGHVEDIVNDERFYGKFFVDDTEFARSINSFCYERFDHNKNIRALESRLTQCFLHLVSETLATSYYPFITEKFLYSVVTRGLFVTYGQPGWHTHLERYYGFKRFNKIFDYRFDSVMNPVERLIELISMISKFSRLSSDDWRDLYAMESDAIEFNYEHFASGKYLTWHSNFIV